MCKDKHLTSLETRKTHRINDLFEYKVNRTGDRYIEREMVGKWDDCTETVTFIPSAVAEKWIIQLTTSFQMKMMNHLNPAKDSPSSQPTRKTDIVKNLNDWSPTPPPSLSLQLFVVECWYVYKDSLTKHTHTHKRTDEHHKALIVLQ